LTFNSAVNQTSNITFIFCLKLSTKHVYLQKTMTPVCQVGGIILMYWNKSLGLNES
jgi:hypothetical protein